MISLYKNSVVNINKILRYFYGLTFKTSKTFVF